MATTFHLYLRTDKQKKNGEYPIYLRITSNRKHRYLSTGKSVGKKYWNSRKEEVRGTHPSAKAINDVLEQKVKEAEGVQAELGAYGKQSAKAIRQGIKAKQDSDFFTFATQYLDDKKSAGKHSQYVQGVVAFNKVEAFEGERYLPFSQIDSEYLKDFQKFLMVKENNKASTVKKTFQPIRKVIKKALHKQLLHIDPFNDFEIVSNSNPPEKTKLSIEQIRMIEGLNLDPGSSAWHTRNAFLFSFYSGGIRIGDICCLKWQDVRNGRLTYRMNKNSKLFKTQLNDYQIEILSRYSGEPDEYIFPFLNSHKEYDYFTLRNAISSENVKVNRDLDSIADLAGIEENISFHVSRHSFAQYAVENQGLDVYELMHAMRHSKVGTTEQYLKSLDEGLADKAMRKVFKNDLGKPNNHNNETPASGKTETGVSLTTNRVNYGKLR